MRLWTSLMLSLALTGAFLFLPVGHVSAGTSQSSSPGFLGVSVDGMTEQLRERFGAPSELGVLVTEVEPNSPAEAAGLQAGDVITYFEGEGVVSGNQLARSIRSAGAGSNVSFEIVRDSSNRTLYADLGERAMRSSDRDWDEWSEDWEERSEEWGEHWAEWGERWAEKAEEWAERWEQDGEQWQEHAEEWEERAEEWGEHWEEWGEHWAEWGEEWGERWSEIAERIAESVGDAEWDTVGEDVAEAMDRVDWDAIGQSVEDAMAGVDWDRIGDDVAYKVEAVDWESLNAQIQAAIHGTLERLEEAGVLEEQRQP